MAELVLGFFIFFDLVCLWDWMTKPALESATFSSSLQGWPSPLLSGEICNQAPVFCGNSFFFFPLHMMTVLSP